MTTIQIELAIPKEAQSCKGCEHNVCVNGMEKDYCNIFKAVIKTEKGYKYIKEPNVRIPQCLEAQSLAETNAGELEKLNKVIERMDRDKIRLNESRDYLLKLCIEHNLVDH